MRFTSIATACALGALLAIGTIGQVAPQPAFEVASIRKNKSGDPSIGMFPPRGGRFAVKNVTLASLIQEAYRLGPNELSGGPGWIRSDRYDITARAPGNPGRPQMLLMLQGLLAERFKLKVHREEKILPAYRLVIGRNGSKLHRAEEAAAGTNPAGTRIGRGIIQGHNVSMLIFTNFLASELGRPVLDKTGLVGKYDVDLRWVPDEGQPNSGGIAPPADSPGPSIFAAVQEQLGLKLEPAKAPVQVLLVEHAEKPDEN